MNTSAQDTFFSSEILSSTTRLFPCLRLLLDADDDDDDDDGGEDNDVEAETETEGIRGASCGGVEGKGAQLSHSTSSTERTLSMIDSTERVRDGEEGDVEEREVTAAGGGEGEGGERRCGDVDLLLFARISEVTVKRLFSKQMNKNISDISITKVDYSYVKKEKRKKGNNEE